MASIVFDSILPTFDSAHPAFDAERLELNSVAGFVCLIFGQNKLGYFFQNRKLFDFATL